MSDITVQNILKEARGLHLDDEDQSERRFDDKQLWRAVREARTLILKARPRARLDTDGSERTLATISGPNGSTSIDEEWLPAMAEWVAFRARSLESGDESDQARAKMHRDTFFMLLKL